MNVTIRLTKVEHEMLKELQKRDKRYKKGLEEKVKYDIIVAYGKKLIRAVKPSKKYFKADVIHIITKSYAAAAALGIEANVKTKIILMKDS